MFVSGVYFAFVLTNVLLNFCKELFRRCGNFVFCISLYKLNLIYNVYFIIHVIYKLYEIFSWKSYH